MDFIKNLIRILLVPIVFPISTYWGSYTLNKKVKKNKKEQDPNLHPFDERFKYLRKKAKSILKQAGIKLEVVGIENLPKGGAWIVSNHTSNLDGIYVAAGIGGKIQTIPVAKDSLKNNFMFKGYFSGVDAMFLDRRSPRQNLSLLNAAAQYAKQKNRGIVIFPEGTRSLTTELLPFKNGLFKFPQKYFLPIVTLTILGSLQAKRFYLLKTRKVTIIIDKVIKPIEHSKLPTDILGKKIKDSMQKHINEYEGSLSEKELKLLKKLKARAKIFNDKKEIKLKKELER